MKKLLFPSALLLFCFTGAMANDHHEDLLCGKVDKKEFTEKMSDKENKLLKKLNLSKDQENKINEIRESRSGHIFTQVQKIRTDHKQLLAAIESNESDEKIRERYKVLGRDKLALMDAKLEQTLAIRASLSADQRRKAIDEIHEKADEMCD